MFAWSTLCPLNHLPSPLFLFLVRPHRPRSDWPQFCGGLGQSQVENSHVVRLCHRGLLSSKIFGSRHLHIHTGTHMTVTCEIPVLIKTELKSCRRLALGFLCTASQTQRFPTRRERRSRRWGKESSQQQGPLTFVGTSVGYLAVRTRVTFNRMEL